VRACWGQEQPATVPNAVASPTSALTSPEPGSLLATEVARRARARIQNTVSTPTPARTFCVARLDLRRTLGQLV
jgi:hypothetical protein